MKLNIYINIYLLLTCFKKFFLDFISDLYGIISKFYIILSTLTLFFLDSSSAIKKLLKKKQKKAFNIYIFTKQQLFAYLLFDQFIIII